MSKYQSHSSAPGSFCAIVILLLLLSQELGSLACSPPVVDHSDTHHYKLGVEETVSITCRRTCGDFLDQWIMLVHKINTNSYVTIVVARDTIDGLTMTWPWLTGFMSIQLNSNDACVGEKVNFTLMLTLKERVQNTANNIIVSCGALCRCENCSAVYASFSAVVYLPLEEDCRNRTCVCNNSGTPGPTTSNFTILNSDMFVIACIIGTTMAALVAMLLV